jgi:hypothetical protein
MVADREERSKPNRSQLWNYFWQTKINLTNYGSS